MRPEKNPLDLNNLPDDFSRDPSKQHLSFDPHDSSSSSGYRKKKSGVKDGKDESGKVYECRFCSLKFCKSQALGGHMNRHRQERETETLNRARQLVFNNDNVATAQGPPNHLGCHPSYIGGGGGMYPPRLFSASPSSTLLQNPPPPPPPPPYPSSSRLTSYPQPPHINDYYVGHVLSTHHHHYTPESNYTCIGAPVGHGSFMPTSTRPTSDSSAARDQNLEARFQDGF